MCGKPVGVHISRGRSVDQLVEDQIADVQEDSDPDASVNKLLRLLLSHTDRKAATAAALKAVLTLPSRKVVPLEEPVSPKSASPPATAETPPEPIPDPESFLDGFPRCKHLVETFRANPSTHNKTPLAILHEYATRLGLEVCPYAQTSSPTFPTTFVLSDLSCSIILVQLLRCDTGTVLAVHPPQTCRKSANACLEKPFEKP